jgi:hypothetical protein
MRGCARRGAVSVRWSAWRVHVAGGLLLCSRVLRRCCFCLLIVAMVPFGSLVQLSLQYWARNSSGVLEHEPAPVEAGSKQGSNSGYRKGNQEPPLYTAHPPFPDYAPQRQHGKQAQAYECKLFVGLHHPVDRLAMCDVLFGLKPRDHRSTGSEYTDHEHPERYLPEDRSPADQCHQIEEDRRHQQGYRQIVQKGMESGPVIAEHEFSRRAV